MLALALHKLSLQSVQDAAVIPAFETLMKLGAIMIKDCPRCYYIYVV